RCAVAIPAAPAVAGAVPIPAFAVARTEVIPSPLHRRRAAGAVPRPTVSVDSPMALAALRVYRRAVDEGADDVRAGIAGWDGLLDGDHIVEVHHPEESKALAGVHVPSIIVSASGMATGGRVIHHL